MKCDMKIMLKTGVGLALLVAVAYAVFPNAREWIVAVSPFLFFLICPLMMFFMMKGMQSCHAEHSVKKNEVASAPASEATNTAGSPLSLNHKKSL